VIITVCTFPKRSEYFLNEIFGIGFVASIFIGDAPNQPPESVDAGTHGVCISFRNLREN